MEPNRLRDDSPANVTRRDSPPAAGLRHGQPEPPPNFTRRHSPPAAGLGDGVEALRVMDASGHRDALIGGLILVVLGVAVSGLGIWAFLFAEDLKADPTNSERSGLGYVFGWLFLGLAVILVMLGASAARGGSIARKLAGIVGAGCGGLIVLSGLPLLAGAVLLAAPFFVSAYLLLRSPGRPTRRG